MMNNTNIPVMPVSKIIRDLGVLFTPLINNNLPYSQIPSPFLWGPPGVGKSDAIRQLAEILEASTGKKVNVTDIRLLLFSPIDLRGVPVADENKQFTDWLKPRILDLDPSKDTVNILFLDELSAAPVSVQASAYQLTLNRAIGEHRLPDNTIVVAAGNRTTDRSVAFKMPSALANRMMHFEAAVDFKSWSEWAVSKGDVHPLVLAYLSFDNSKLYLEDSSLQEVAFPTPRSWMFVSNILNTLSAEGDLESYRSLITSCIGAGCAGEFIAFSKKFGKIPDIEDIFEGKICEAPKELDLLYSIVSSMVTFAVSKERNNEYGGLLMDEVENASRYLSIIPVDFAVNFLRQISGEETLAAKFAKSKNLKAWEIKHNKILVKTGINFNV